MRLFPGFLLRLLGQSYPTAVGNKATWLSVTTQQTH